jgi:hypothetical protein
VFQHNQVLEDKVLQYDRKAPCLVGALEDLEELPVVLVKPESLGKDALESSSSMGWVEGSFRQLGSHGFLKVLASFAALLGAKQGIYYNDWVISKLHSLGVWFDNLPKGQLQMRTDEDYVECASSPEADH